MTKRFEALATNPFLRTVIESSDFGILALDRQSRLIAWNAWLAERTALPEEAAVGKTLAEALPGVPETTLTLCAEVLGTGQPRVLSPALHQVLIPFTKPSQQTGRLYPVYDERNRVSGVVLFLHDVSPVLEYERLAADEVGTERRERETIFHAIGHPVFILDRAHTILSVNRATERLTGVSEKELIGRKCHEVMHGASAPASWCPCEKTRMTGVLESSEGEVETLGRTFLVSCTPLLDRAGNLEKIIHIAMDITDRRRAEREQALLNRQLAALWRLAQLDDADEENFSDHVLMECLDITGSGYGFFGFLTPDEAEMHSYSLSRDVREDCRLAKRPVIFSIANAGVWAEAVRQRRPLVINDYDQDHPAKKGLPEGHVPLTRLMSVPIMVGGRVTLVIAVANKTSDYTDEDVRQLDAFFASVRLVFEKRRAEAALLKNRQLLKESQTIARLGGWEYNVQEKHVSWTEEVYRIHGVDGSYDPSNPAKGICFYDPEYQARIEEAFSRAVEKGESYDLELPLITAQGEKRWVRTMGRAERRDGRITRVFGNIMDITEHKQIEDTLRESVENFRRSLEGSPLGVRIISDQGETLFANRTLLDIYGYDSPEELNTTPTRARYTPESYQAFLARREKRRRGDSLSSDYEIDIVRKDGGIRHLQVFRKEAFWNGKIHSQALYNDITEKRRMEEALRLSEERYRAFVKQSTEAICLFEIAHAPIDTALPTDEQINLLYAHAVIGECNRVFAKSHGYGEPEEMIGFKIGQIFPRLASQNVDYLRAFIENGHQISDVETKELARDGSVKHFLNSLTSHVEQGRLIRVWGAKQDITRLKSAEAEVRILNAELERRVTERTAQLAASNKELEAFAYSVSHDLRAPLRAVDGYANILIEDYTARLDDEGQRVCSVISQSARTMGRLIDDLLTYSRTGRVALQFSAVDMGTLVRSIFFEATSHDQRERIDFRVGDLPVAQGDPTLLRQVWTNLLSNAVKFSGKRERAVIEVGSLPAGRGAQRPGLPEDGASPSAGTASASGLSEEVSSPVYFVRDNGAGFDMAYADKLFGVFQRLHSAREYPGTGVGLAIVQRIIQRHDGRIWAEGEVGKGAVFFFTLGKG